MLGAVQQLYEQVGRVVSSKGSLMAKQDRGHKLLGSTEALKQVIHEIQNRALATYFAIFILFSFVLLNYLYFPKGFES